MIWVWFAGAAALLLFLLYWAIFLNRPNPDVSDADSFEKLLSEAASFYRQVSVSANPAFRNGVGVSILRFSPVKENRSVLGAKRDDQPAETDVPDSAGSARDAAGTNGTNEANGTDRTLPGE